MQSRLLLQSSDLTYCWEVLQHSALHGQLVQVCIQKGEDPFWEDAFRFAHGMSTPRCPCSDVASSSGDQPFLTASFTDGSKRVIHVSLVTRLMGTATSDVNCASVVQARQHKVCLHPSGHLIHYF